MPDTPIIDSYFAPEPRALDLDQGTPAKADDRKPAADVSAVQELEQLHTIGNVLDRAQSNLDAKYKFNANKYNEAQSRDGISRLANDLVAAGVPPWVVRHGLQEAEQNLGQRGFRDWRHWHHQKAVDASVIEKGLDRMRRLLDPVASAAARGEQASRHLSGLRHRLDSAKAELKPVEEQWRNLEAYEPDTKYGREARLALQADHKRLKAAVDNYEDAIRATEQEIADSKAAIAQFHGADPALTHHQKVQRDLRVAGSDPRFAKTLDALKPGDLNKGVGGTLRRLQLGKAAKDYTLSIATLSGSEWYRAIKSQDKAKRLVAAQQRMPTPTARAMAGIMLDEFDAAAYSTAMNAALTTVSLPTTLFGAVSGVGAGMAMIPAHLAVSAHATGTSTVGAMNRATSGTGSAVGYGAWGHSSAIGSGRDAAVDRSSNRDQRLPPEVPSVPTTMASGDVKRLDLTDKRATLALLIHLGPKVDQQKIKSGDAHEIARQDLRREIFKADDEEDLVVSPDSGKVVNRDGKAGLQRNRELMEALFYEDTPNREQILASATPMETLFAATGLLRT